MKLVRVSIEGYKSIKTRQELFVDSAVTVLIGANDHGKSNVLYAITELNAAWIFSPEDGEDRHWDLTSKTLPHIDWCFELDDRELKSLAAIEYSNLSGEMLQSHTEQDFHLLVATSRGNEVRYSKTGYGTGHEVYWGGGEIPSNIAKLLLDIRPKVELFSSSQQVVDEITAEQLDEPKFEFMKGIFMMAGLWEKRTAIFTQNSRTSRILDEASAELTRTLQSQWEQGKDLTWRFKHRGEAIVLEIQDPAVSETYIRPSQRSAGFTSFFILALTIYARIASSPERSRIFLFDEPGTYLHPIAQINLQRVFEALAERTQIIYTTHSLFLVNKNVPSRNKVIRKTENGTTIDKRPYHRNWKSVRDSLGLMLSQNFLIADRTLLVEGPSDEVYLLGMLSYLIRSGTVDIDLNDFSIADAGTSSNQLAMAKLMLEDGRKVMVLADGDTHGERVKRDLIRIAHQDIKQSKLAVQLWPKGCSVEDLLISKDLYGKAIEKSASLLADGGVRHYAESLSPQDRMLRLTSIIESGDRTNTLGRAVADETERWFKEKEAISKLLIAEQYEALLRQVEPNSATVDPRLLSVVHKLMSVMEMQPRKAEKSILQADDDVS